MNVRLLLFAAVALAATCDFAQARQAAPAWVAEACRRELCHRPKDKPDAPALPVIQHKMLAIYPGETLFVQAVIDAKGVSYRRASLSNDAPEQMLAFRLDALPGDGGTTLRIHNPFKQSIRFSIGIMQVDSAMPDKVYATASCPVGPGKSSAEHWPGRLFQVVLRDPEVLAPGEAMDCK
ncbi:hypothetical protein BH09PSE6_BH09PSE6_18130 [soil metagenome]